MSNIIFIVNITIAIGVLNYIMDENGLASTNWQVGGGGFFSVLIIRTGCLPLVSENPGIRVDI